MYSAIIKPLAPLTFEGAIWESWNFVLITHVKTYCSFVGNVIVVVRKGSNIIIIIIM